MSRQELREMLEWCLNAEYADFDRVSINTSELLWLLRNALGE